MITIFAEHRATISVVAVAEAAAVMKAAPIPRVGISRKRTGQTQVFMRVQETLPISSLMQFHSNMSNEQHLRHRHPYLTPHVRSDQGASATVAIAQGPWQRTQFFSLFCRHAAIGRKALDPAWGLSPAKASPDVGPCNRLKFRHEHLSAALL